MKTFVTRWKTILDGGKATTSEIRAEIEGLEAQKIEAGVTLAEIQKALERGHRSQLAGEKVDTGQIRADLQAVRDRIGALDAVINDLELEFENALNMEGQARIDRLKKQLAAVERLRAEGEEKLIDQFAKTAALFQSVRGVSGDQLDFRAFAMTPSAFVVREKIREYSDGRNFKAEIFQLKHEMGEN
jgi:archaellum component FlaC